MLVNRWTILEEHIDIVIVVDSVNLKVVKNQGTDLEAIPNLEGVYSIVPRKSLPGHGMQIWSFQMLFRQMLVVHVGKFYFWMSKE